MEYRPHHSMFTRHEYTKKASSNQLNTTRTSRRGGTRHPTHLNDHMGYARLGIRGVIRQRRRFFIDFYGWCKDFMKSCVNIYEKIASYRPK